MPTTFIATPAGISYSNSYCISLLFVLETNLNLSLNLLGDKVFEFHKYFTDAENLVDSI